MGPLRFRYGFGLWIRVAGFCEGCSGFRARGHRKPKELLATGASLRIIWLMKESHTRRSWKAPLRVPPLLRGSCFYFSLPLSLRDSKNLNVCNGTKFSIVKEKGFQQFPSEARFGFRFVLGGSGDLACQLWSALTGALSNYNHFKLAEPTYMFVGSYAELCRKVGFGRLSYS